MKGAVVEIGHYNEAKSGERAEGDVFHSRKVSEEGRIIAVLSDGLGSGVKANVLATITATMAAGLAASDVPMRRTASLIMRTLPVCSERKISYATFTILDVGASGETSIIEYDNPPYILVREGDALKTEKAPLPVRRRKSAGIGEEAILRWSSFAARLGDRIVFFSDGVSQAGMGSRRSPLGWSTPAVHSFIVEAVRAEPGISARELAKVVVREALARDSGAARDDITCGVLYFRDARRLLVLSGPPLNPERDAEMARIFSAYQGRRLVAGGTTASIISRETGAKVKVELGRYDPEIPPAASMEGADLVTEGIITLGRTAELLASRDRFDDLPRNASTRAIELMLDSDVIDFVIGTKINEAHQDPNMPVELEIRRNIVKRLASILEEKYLKDVRLRFI